MSPVAQADGHDGPGLLDEGVPGEAAVIEIRLFWPDAFGPQRAPRSADLSGLGPDDCHGARMGAAYQSREGARSRSHHLDRWADVILPRQSRRCRGSLHQSAIMGSLYCHLHDYQGYSGTVSRVSGQSLAYTLFAVCVVSTFNDG